MRGSRFLLSFDLLLDLLWDSVLVLVLDLLLEAEAAVLPGLRGVPRPLLTNNS